MRWRLNATCAWQLAGKRKGLVPAENRRSAVDRFAFSVFINTVPTGAKVGRFFSFSFRCCLARGPFSSTYSFQVR